MQERSFWQAFGPGLLFAGAAVGVSHLVQSTRAGATYGLALIGVVIAANILKYPAFRFGPLYAAATGTSLLEGYRRQGKWALWLYGVVTVATMFTVEAAVAVVTAGLLKAMTGTEASPITISAVLIGVCAAILAVGSYRWLDRIIKVVVAVLTISTIAAAALAAPKLDFAAAQWVPSAAMLDGKSLFFIAALVGWMPSAIDVAVWQSLWVLARSRDAGGEVSVRDALLDFDIGYLGTVVLAFCFLLLGAAVMHGSGVAFSSSAGGFAAQVLDLYAQSLGPWSRPVIGVCGFAVMFSTTLTVVDGFPRALSVLVGRLKEPEDPDRWREEEEDVRRAYWIALAVIGIGSIVVLFAMLKSLAAMVDLATTLSFLTAPVLAWLNHRAVHSESVPPASRPAPWLTAMSWLGITFLGAFASYYLFLRFVA